MVASKWALACFVILQSACATSQPLLNSDLIEKKFGSYGVEVVRQDENQRVSSLYSFEGGERITRTLAMVHFLGREEPALQAIHEAILAGSSIGKTFRDAGWAIDKMPLRAEEITATVHDVEIGELMHIELPARLAAFSYDFVVSKNGQTHDYARITEIYHPDYLKLKDLTIFMTEPFNQADASGSLKSFRFSDCEGPNTIIKLTC